MVWYLKVVKDNFGNFSGRASRKEFWMFSLFYMIFFSIAFILDMFFTFGLLTLIYVTVHVCPSIAVSIRRLHDLNKSGWYLLVSIIPIVGIIWLTVLMAKKSDDGENQYDSSPTVAPVSGEETTGEVEIIGAETEETVTETEESDDGENQYDSSPTVAPVSNQNEEKALEDKDWDEFTATEKLLSVVGVVGGGAFLIYFLFNWLLSPSIEDKVEDAIAPLLHNPSSLEIVLLYGPYTGEFFVSMGGGSGFMEDLTSGCSKIESYTANITASNAFGGTVREIYFVFFKDGDVCGTYTAQGGTMIIDGKVSRDCGCG
jgi:uncharacterized membrane protein YhaH (DUF805 family)